MSNYSTNHVNGKGCTEELWQTGLLSASRGGSLGPHSAWGLYTKGAGPFPVRADSNTLPLPTHLSLAHICTYACSCIHSESPFLHQIFHCLLVNPNLDWNYLRQITSVLICSIDGFSSHHSLCVRVCVATTNIIFILDIVSKLEIVN